MSDRETHRSDVDLEAGILYDTVEDNYGHASTRDLEAGPEPTGFLYTVGKNYNVGTSYGITYGTTYVGTTYDIIGYDKNGNSEYGINPTEIATGNAIDAGYGTTTYDPQYGTYDQHFDYMTPNSRRHHHEKLGPDGVYTHRDVDDCDDGTTQFLKEYDNPNTGIIYVKSYHR